MKDKEKRKAWFEKRYEEAKLAYAALMLLYPLTLENLEGEIWAWIEGYEDLYQISTFGRVKSFHNGKIKILKPLLNSVGYLQAYLQKNGKYKHCYIHILVAQTFISNLENKSQVNHKFGIRFDNYFENLEWTTQSENSQHAVKMGLIKVGYERSDAKLTAEQVRYIRENYIPRDKKLGAKALAEKFNVDSMCIIYVVQGKTYKNVD